MVQPPPDGPFVAEGNIRAASAKALKAGTDMACHAFDRLMAADVTPKELDAAARRVLTARVRCGGLRGLLGCWVLSAAALPAAAGCRT